MIFDLIVVGNGLAAQTFLFELFIKRDVNNSQNFSVAQIYSEEIAPACSLRSTATVSLNGVEEDVSELGNQLRESFFLFNDFQIKHAPWGVEKIKQVIVFSSENSRAKMIRRFKHLTLIKHPVLKSEMEGVVLDSFLVSPKNLNDWFKDRLSHRGIVEKKSFLKSIAKNKDAIFECELLGGEIIKTKKIVVCSGAYDSLFSSFFIGIEELKKTKIVPGSFLERSIDLSRDSFYLTLDQHNMIYRNEDKKLIIGSSSNDSGIMMADHAKLSGILEMYNELCHFNFGAQSDFKVVTGLRHKAHGRRAVARAMDLEKNIFMINGLYKNGFSLTHWCAKKILEELNL